MLKAPRFHSLSATTALNLTALLTANWSPDNNENAGRVDATQATVGRISFRKQLRGGSVGAIVLARSLVPVATTMQIRSANAAEYAECKPPVGTVPVADNILISTQQLTTGWSAPIILSPTDAMCFGTDAATAGTVEWQTYDLEEESGVAWINGILAAAGADTCCSSDSLPVTETTTLLAFPVNTRYVFVSAAAGSVVTYPALAALELDQKMVFVRVGGGVVYLIPPAGEQQNGEVNGIVELDGRLAVTVVRRETTFTASKQNLSAGQSLLIDVADETIAIAAMSAPIEAVRIEATLSGFAQLPSLTAWATGDVMTVQHNGGNGQITIIPAVGESLNNVVNGRVYLGAFDVALIHKSPWGYVVTTSVGGSPIRVITQAASGTLELFGAALVVRATLAGAQTITMPANTRPIMPGARVRFYCLGAGGLTINGGGANIAPGSGAAAATLVLVQFEIVDMVWDGTLWQSIPVPPGGP